MPDEHPNILYATEVVFEDLDGEETSVISWRTVEEIEQIIKSAAEEDFIRIEDADRKLHSKRKEHVKSYTVARVAVVSARRARKPIRPKEAVEKPARKKIKNLEN